MPAPSMTKPAHFHRLEMRMVAANIGPVMTIKHVALAWGSHVAATAASLRGPLKTCYQQLQQAVGHSPVMTTNVSRMSSR